MTDASDVAAAADETADDNARLLKLLAYGAIATVVADGVVHTNASLLLF